MAEPVYQPFTYDDVRRLTRQSTKHGGATVYQIELSLTISIGDAGKTKEDG
jgi:hypothetical protein